MNPDVEKLVEQNVQLAYWMANKLYRKHPQYNIDDIIGDCMMSLFKAARHYDPAKGSFSTLYSYVATQEFAKQRYYHKPIPPPMISIDKYEESGTHFDPLDETSEYDFEQYENADRCESIMRHLLERDSELLKERYLQDKSIKEMAERRGVSQQRVRFLVGQALKRARKELEKIEKPPSICSIGKPGTDHQ